MIVNLSQEETMQDKLGNKGKFLLQMKKQGFEVPGGYILTSDVYEATLAENGLTESLQRVLRDLTAENLKSTVASISGLFDGANLPKSIIAKMERLSEKNKRYAVRSSGSKEDLAGASFAGQYDTFLNVAPKEIPARVIDCYRSMFSVRLLQYVLGHKVDPASLKMSVIVQEMVDAQYSGICFTIDPATGNDKEMLIEVSEGLGENIVSGRTVPEQYHYNWLEGEETKRVAKNHFLSPEMVSTCGKTFAEIQQFFGYPCDIEFAIADGKLYILQAREITKIQYGEIEYTWTTADFKDGGVSATVCSPYMWSLYEYIWEYSLRKFVVLSELLTDEELPKKLGEMFYGRPYWNLSAVKKAMSQVIGYKEREFDQEYGITGDYEGDGEVTKATPQTLFKMSKVVVRQSQILQHRRANAQHYKEELLHRYDIYKKIYDERRIVDIEKEFYRITKKTYLRSETTYFWQIFINTVHQSLYKDSLLKYVSESEYLTLLGSIENISHLLPFYEMWDVTRAIRSDEQTTYFWQQDAKLIAQSLESNEYCMPQVRAILAKYGYHSDKELDITYPCYFEEPEVLVGMVKDMAALDDSFSPMADQESGKKKYQEVLRRIKKKVSPYTYQKICKKVKGMRNMLWWREEFRDVSTRFYYLLRVYTMEYAKKLENDGVLERWEDVWFLKVGNLWDYIDGRVSAEKLRKILKKNRYYYNAYRNYTSENEIGTKIRKVTAEDGSEAKIKGLGANNGTVTGVARVIEDFTQIDRLKEGDILVTRFTDTGWTPKFAILSGIVTEYGGILCHAAIVSREYGIPAVVCCKDAMSKIRDGQIITVDGGTGAVTLEG